MDEWDKGMIFGLVIGVVLVALISALIYATVDDNKETDRINNFCIENGYDEIGRYDQHHVCIRKEGNTKHIARIKVNGDGIFFVKFNGEKTNAVADEQLARKVKK